MFVNTNMNEDRNDDTQKQNQNTEKLSLNEKDTEKLYFRNWLGSFIYSVDVVFSILMILA
jgi:hypothetical protein